MQPLTIDRDTIRHCQSNLANYYGHPLKTDGEVGPITRAAVRRYQAAFHGYDLPLGMLDVDGILGPHTATRIIEFGPKLSAHFGAGEFRSRDGAPLVVDRKLIGALEVLRSLRGGQPLPIVSGHRSILHNQVVGGASRSMHAFHVFHGLRGGGAADLSSDLQITKMDAMQAGFGGLGLKRVGRRIVVTHVDVRTSPATWRY